MDETRDVRRRVFVAKTPELIAELNDWYDEETASIDGSIASEAPSGTGGSIISTAPSIDSKRVVDATVATQTVLGIELPPQIIKPGGYDSFDEMIDDLLPKLEKVFTGEIKVKKRKPVAARETV